MSCPRGAVLSSSRPPMIATTQADEHEVGQQDPAADQEPLRGLAARASPAPACARQFVSQWPCIEPCLHELQLGGLQVVVVGRAGRKGGDADQGAGRRRPAARCATTCLGCAAPARTSAAPGSSAPSTAKTKSGRARVDSRSQLANGVAGALDGADGAPQRNQPEPVGVGQHSGQRHDRQPRDTSAGPAGCRGRSVVA